MAKSEKCDQCEEEGLLGPEIRAYAFAAPKGNNVVRFLHASDGGRPCYQDYVAKYRKWISEQRAKAVSNG